MQLTAVKGDEGRDRVYVQLDDGTEVSWSWPSYGRSLAHDLAHWVVESELGLDEGLWGLVASGVDPSRVNKAAERIATGVRLRDMTGRDTTQLMQAEFVTAALGRTDRSPAGAVAYVVEQCDEAGISGVDGLDVAAVERMAARAEDLNRRWQAIAPDAGLVLAWPPADVDP